MTQEEIIKHLHEALNSVDITFPYRYVLVEAIEALSQPSLPSNLDEAAEEYAENTWMSGENWADAARRTFKAGAEWRYQKDRGEFAKLKAKEWSDGYNEGIARGKEKMLEDAIEIEVKADAGGYPYIDATELYDYTEEKNIFNPGDIVLVNIRKK